MAAHPAAYLRRRRPTIQALAALTTLAVLVAGCSAATVGTEDPTGDPAAQTSATTTQGETGSTAATEGAELAPIELLRIRHPQQLAFAAPFHLMAAEGALTGQAETVDIGEWATPDVLRAMLVNGESEVTAVPTYVGANLANKGVDVQMAAVVVWGLLWVLGPDGEPADWEALRGQTVMVPFRNDMPDLVFRHLAEANGLTPGEDFEVEYYAAPPEVVSRLVSGKGRWAVLPDHMATVALTKAGQNGQDLGRVMDLQAEWGQATGSEPRIPQAGIVVPSALALEHPELLGGILDALEEAVATVNAADDDTVAYLAEATGLPASVVKDVIPRLNLEVVPAAEARDELEAFYTELADLSPDIIGGQLPDASFYLDDPR